MNIRDVIDPADGYAKNWLGYTAAFDNLLSAWEEGVFAAMWPGSPLPLSQWTAILHQVSPLQTRRRCSPCSFMTVLDQNL